jgi:hypothetical protein
MDSLPHKWYQSSPGLKPPVRDPFPSSAEVVNGLEVYFAFLCASIGLSCGDFYLYLLINLDVMLYTEFLCYKLVLNVVEVLFGLYGMQFILSR